MGNGKENLSQPPALASMLVQLCSERAVRDALLGDLQETYQHQAATDTRAARAWYWRQAFTSLTPLLRRRAHRSIVISALFVIALTVAALAGVYAWQEFVARSAARGFATAFDGVPIYAARLVYVAVQMLSVIAAALAIAAATFDPDRTLFHNALRRLSLFSVLVLVPPFVESLVSPNGYSLAFVLPWAGAMAVALFIGGRLGAKLAA